MGEIMNSPKGVKSGVPEMVNISCPTCGTRHDVHQITVSEQTIQHMWHRGVQFVNKVLWRPYNFPKVVWNCREEYPCSNNFETRIYPRT